MLQNYPGEAASNDQFSVQQSDLYNPEIHLPSAPTDWTGYEAATPLWHDLAALIGVTGQPLSTAEYMRACLTHPVHGYYVNAGNSNDAAIDDFDKEDYDDEDDWNPNKAAGVCLMLLATCCENDVGGHVLPFVKVRNNRNNITNILLLHDGKLSFHPFIIPEIGDPLKLAK